MLFNPSLPPPFPIHVAPLSNFRSSVLLPAFINFIKQGRRLLRSSSKEVRPWAGNPCGSYCCYLRRYRVPFKLSLILGGPLGVQMKWCMASVAVAKLAQGCSVSLRREEALSIFCDVQEFWLCCRELHNLNRRTEPPLIRDSKKVPLKLD